MKTKKRLFLLAVAVTFASGSSLSACHRCERAITQVKHRFDGRIAQLRSAVDAERDAIRCTRRDALKQLSHARRAANQLCGHERRLAIRNINSMRKSVMAQYRHDMTALRQYYKTTLARLRNSYEVVVARVPTTYCVSSAPITVSVSDCRVVRSSSATIFAPELQWDEPDVIFEEDWNSIEAPNSTIPQVSPEWEIHEQGPAFPALPSEPFPNLPGTQTLPVEPIPAPPEVMSPGSSYQVPLPGMNVTNVNLGADALSTSMLRRQVSRTGRTTSKHKVVERIRVNDRDHGMPILAQLMQLFGQ